MQLIRTSIVLCALAGTALAQQVTQVSAEHRSGQTFLLWNETPDALTRYRVYRSTSPISTAVDLDTADFLGEVDADSSFNLRRSLAEGAPRTWVVAPGGAELPNEWGLFVNTVGADASAWYAVTTVSADVEDRTVTAGMNATTTALTELVAAPQPVIQAVSGNVTTWAHWGSDEATPLQEALAAWPSTGFNFTLRRSVYPGLRGLVVRLHDSGETYSGAWPTISGTAPDVHVLTLDDGANSVHTHWLGLHDGFPAPASAGNVVDTCTERRMSWTLDWTLGFLAPSHDVERNYAVGAGSGAGGALRLVACRPEIFAAALCRKPALDLGAADVAARTTLDAIFGPVALGLLTDTGFPVYEELSAATLAVRSPEEPWPVVRTLNGRFDAESGWLAAPGFFEAMAASNRPAVHYFDGSTHDGLGYWSAIETTLVSRTLEHRIGRPTLAFDGSDADDDPGAGSPLEGDAQGAVGAYAEYDHLTPYEDANALAFDVHLRNEFALDDAPTSSARVRLAPRGTDLFVPEPGSFVHFTLRDTDGDLCDEHLLWTDPSGLVRTPPAPLTIDVRTARFEPWEPRPDQITTFVGDAPGTGEPVQVVIFGRPDQDWRILVYAEPLPTAPGRPSAQPLGEWRNLVWTDAGVLDPRGMAALAVEVPSRFAQAGMRIAVRMDVDDRHVETTTVTFR